MEDVLEVYHRPYNGQKPVICMDEQPVQVLGEKWEPVPMNEHHSKREDNEYVRKGTCSVFMFIEPLGGRRYVSASSQRTRQDGAREVKSIVMEQYPQVEKVVLVMDNLNTHTLSLLYEAFPTAEAFAIAQRKVTRKVSAKGKGRKKKGENQLELPEGNPKLAREREEKELEHLKERYPAKFAALYEEALETTPKPFSKTDVMSKVAAEGAALGSLRKKYGIAKYPTHTKPAKHLSRP